MSDTVYDIYDVTSAILVCNVIVIIELVTLIVVVLLKWTVMN
jgi:hypothetical protein